MAISFRTLIAAGTVTVLANGETLWQQSFDFDNRRLFKRKYLKGQRGFDETQTLEAGFVELKVKAEVDAKEGLTALESDLMRGTVPPGTTPTLQILITEDGLLKTTWIPP